MKKSKLIFKILVMTIFVLAIGRVVVSNLLSTSGVELGKIDEETAFLKTQNDSLREELFSTKSFENIASEAAKIGFTDNAENFVLTSPPPVALR